MKHLLAVIFLCAALVAQIFGFFSIWRSSKKAEAASGIPLAEDKGSYVTINTEGVEDFIRSQIVPPQDLFVVVIGTLVGFIGSLLSL